MDSSVVSAALPFTEIGAVGILALLLLLNAKERSISAGRQEKSQAAFLTSLKANTDELQNIDSRLKQMEEILRDLSLIHKNHAKHTEEALAQSARNMDSFRTTMDAFLLYVTKQQEKS